jgi:hypothetical protein
MLNPNAHIGPIACYDSDMSLLIVTTNAAALAASKAYRQHQPPMVIAPRHSPRNTDRTASRIANRVRAFFTHPSK